MRRIQRRKKPVDYLLPFLVLISLGVIAVLGFQLWSSFSKQGKADAYFYVVEGRAKMLPFASAEWENAFSGTKLLVGDALKTLPNAKTVLEFFNGTVIRMSGDSAITLADLSKANDRESILINLDNGKVWVKGQKSEGVKIAAYEVRTRSLLVKAVGTVFEVENSDTEERVRVMDGDVSVDVFVPVGDSERVAQTIKVGVGQEIAIDEATLKAFSENKEPSVLKALADDFESSEWYLWNLKEDQNPTNFRELFDSGAMIDSQASGEAISSVNLSTEVTDTTSDQNPAADEDEINNEAGSEDDSDGGGPAKPVITGPAETTTSTGKLQLQGTVKEGTVKVVVRSEINGKKENYLLSKFKQGDTEWSYNLAPGYGNIKPGENKYEVYAFNQDGEKSEPAEIVINYDVSETEITDELADPKVLTYNGSGSNEVTTGAVRVDGEIKGALKVVVNGYELSKFVPGSTSWTYYANETAGNLKPGRNEYSVYGIGADGSKTAEVEFTIVYDKPQNTSEPNSQAVQLPNQPAYGF